MVRITGRPTPWHRHSRPVRRPRRAVLVTLLAALTLLTREGLSADVVVVLSSDDQPYQEVRSVLAKRLPEYGHVSRTVLLEDMTDARLDEAEQRSDLFVAIGTRAAVWLNRRLDKESLLVYSLVSDPEGAGLTERLRTHGISTQVPVATQINLIAEALPKTRSVGMLYRSDTKHSREWVKRLNAVLPEGWRLEPVAVDQYGSFADALKELFRRGPDVVWTAADSSVYDTSSIRALLLAALRHKTPVFGFSTPFVRAGALLGIGIDPRTQGEQTIALIGELVKQSQPQRLPPASSDEQTGIHKAPQFEIAVNLIVAERLGIRLPKDFVHRAKRRFGRKEGTP